MYFGEYTSFPWPQNDGWGKYPSHPESCVSGFLNDAATGWCEKETGQQTHCLWGAIKSTHRFHTPATSGMKRQQGCKPGQALSLPQIPGPGRVSWETGAGSSAQLAHGRQPGLCRAAVSRCPLQVSANMSSPLFLFLLKPLLMQAKLSYLCSTGKEYSVSS